VKKIIIVLLVLTMVSCEHSAGPDDNHEPVINENLGDFALVAAGEFKMGDNFNEGDSDERPVHTVYLDAYYIEKYEVTNGKYKEFINDSGYLDSTYWTAGGFGDYGIQPNYWTNSIYRGGGIAGNENFPVVGISWYEAMAYCAWLSEKTGETYRLPTEAEWEKAARGTDQKRYPWGGNIDGSCANYWDSGDPYEDGLTPVGFYDGGTHKGFKTNDNSSSYGVYDMTGNVWEWCYDRYNIKYYAASPVDNPNGPLSGIFRVLRGGCWGTYYNYRSALRSARRYKSYPRNRFCVAGFRCVREY